MLDVGNASLGNGEVHFAVSVVLGVERKSVESPLNVVPHHSDLSQTSVEGLSGRNVQDISDTENILIVLVLEGLWVNVEETS